MKKLICILALLSVSICFDKLIQFGTMIDFAIEGSTIGKCEERETDTVIRLVNGNKEISLVSTNDGSFDNYTVQTT